MKDKLIDINLSVIITGNEVVANLGFINTTSKKVYLDQQTVCYGNEVRGNYFKIRNEKGKDVDYKGMLLCRDINPEYFVMLNPNEKFETKVNLSEVYELKKGKKYTIQYSTYHPSYLKEQELTKIESNVIEMLYK